jgi:hypothetical protein
MEATRKTCAPQKIALLTPILAPASSLARLGKASSAGKEVLLQNARL